MSFYLVAGHGASTAAPVPGGHLPTARRRVYPSNTSDTEWNLIAGLVPVGGPRRARGGRPVRYSRRDVIDAIRYVAYRSPTPCGSCASRRRRATSRTVTPPPHHRRPRGPTDPRRPSSSAALLRRAAQRLGPLRRVHRSRSAPRQPDPRAGVPGRHVPCAVPLGHPTPTAAPPASSTADSSPSPPNRHGSVTGLSHRRRVERSPPTVSPVSRTPSRLHDPLCYKPLSFRVWRAVEGDR
jgi:hypothetical protein